MTAASTAATEEFVEVAGGRVHLRRAGTGAPVFVLHHDTGDPGWLPFYKTLAQQFSVYVPEHPGFGQSDRPSWMRSVRDLAVLYQWLLARLELQEVSLVGLGFGGWIAAEMATMAPRQFRRLVLAGAMGIQPQNGEIFDQALMNHVAYVKAGFHDPAQADTLFGAEPSIEQLEAWEINREMVFRIAWKPYMFSQTLPHLLGGIGSQTLVVWGRHDRIVPLECGERYADLIPNARLEVLEECGHFLDMECPDEFAAVAGEFLAGA